MNSNTTNERAQVSRCAEPRLQIRMTDLTSESLWALGLAGGDGTRLQSLTHLIAGTSIPKQYCRMLGPRSLLETTLWRIAPLVAPERTLAIINRYHLAIARPQLTSLDARNVLVQRRNLDTGPGVLVSMLLSVVGEAPPMPGCRLGGRYIGLHSAAVGGYALHASAWRARLQRSGPDRPRAIGLARPLQFVRRLGRDR